MQNSHFNGLLFSPRGGGIGTGETPNAPPATVQGNGETGYTGGTSNGATNNEQPAPAFPWMMIVWIGIMFFAMYFLIFRPQRKRAKQAEEMQRSLRVNDKVMTSGGMHGTIMGVGEDSFLVEFGENRGVRIWIRKSDVLGIKEPITTPPPEPAKETPAEDKKEDKK